MLDLRKGEIDLNLGFTQGEIETALRVMRAYSRHICADVGDDQYGETERAMELQMHVLDEAHFQRVLANVSQQEGIHCFLWRGQRQKLAAKKAKAGTTKLHVTQQEIDEYADI